MRRFNHAACLRSLDLLVKFFEDRLAARRVSKDRLDKELIESTRLDVKELRQLRSWVEKKRYVTAIRYFWSLDSYLRDYMPKRTLTWLSRIGWEQYVKSYADGRAYAKRFSKRPRAVLGVTK